MHDAWTKATCVCTFSPVAKTFDRQRKEIPVPWYYMYSPDVRTVVCNRSRTHMTLYAMSTAVTCSQAAINFDSTVALFIKLHELFRVTDGFGFVFLVLWSLLRFKRRIARQKKMYKKTALPCRNMIPTCRNSYMQSIGVRVVNSHLPMYM